VEPLAGLEFRRAAAPTELGHGVSFPALCVVGQGSKELLLGGTRYRYDPAHYLITTAELPIASRITEASPERPYLRVLLKLDPALVGAVIVEAGQLAPRSPSAVPAINVSPLDAGLLDAVVRLVRLVDCPTEARVLAPLITWEIVFRLLLGEGLDAASAGLRVGYSNAAHFTREGQATVWRAADARCRTAAGRRQGTGRVVSRVGAGSDSTQRKGDGVCLRGKPARPFSGRHPGPPA